VDPTTRLGADAYERPVTERVYRELAERATVALRAGHAVVLDAVFGDPTERVAMAEVARAAGVPFTGLWLEAPTDVMASRVERRQRDASDATIDVLRQQTARGTGPLDWIRLDASGTREEVQRRAEDRLHT
jgi:predicted kinase